MDWINIRDKKPEIGQKVLTFFDVTGIEIATYYRPYPHNQVEGLEKMDCFENRSGWLCDDVTHWMPLPARPESTP